MDESRKAAAFERLREENTVASLRLDGMVAPTARLTLSELQVKYKVRRSMFRDSAADGSRNSVGNDVAIDNVRFD